ncbi:MAG: hypothetical protein LBL67_04550 [Coriobacteriales bacterium]|jgi:uncharacterized surface anchored protein|nr:hypothetical protein [Coriobacteriales bacterium]
MSKLRTLGSVLLALLIAVFLVCPTAFGQALSAAAQGPSSDTQNATKAPSDQNTTEDVKATQSAASQEDGQDTTKSQPDATAQAPGSDSEEGQSATNSQNKNSSAPDLVTPVGGNDIRSYFSPGDQAPTILDYRRDGVFRLQAFDPEGKLCSDQSRVPADATLRVGLRLRLPERIRARLQPGDYYRIQLPDSLKVGRSLNDVGLTDPNTRESFACFSLSKGGLVTITMLPALAYCEASVLSGGLAFLVGFDLDHLTKPGSLKLALAGEPQVPAVQLELLPAAGRRLSVSGQVDRANNPKVVTWQVDLNTDLARLKSAALFDQFPQGLRLFSAKLFELELDLQGKVVGQRAATPGRASLDQTTGMVHFTGDIKEAFRVVYSCRVTGAASPNEDGNASFVNLASLTAQGQAKVSAKATVEARFGSMLERVWNGYDPGTGLCSYTIKYNYTEQLIPAGQGKLTDSIIAVEPATTATVMFFRPDTLSVQGLSWDQSDQTVPGPVLAPGIDYDVAFNAAADQLSITFLHDIDQALQIRYSYQGNYLDQDYRVQTETCDAQGLKASCWARLVDRILDKRVVANDYLAKTVTWQLTFNQDRAYVTGARFYDQLDQGARHELLLQTLAAFDQTTGLALAQIDPATPGAADLDGFCLDYSDPGEDFSISLTGRYRQTNDNIVFSYQTHYHGGDLSEAKPLLVNATTLSFADDAGRAGQNTSGATFWPVAAERKRGLLEGRYNAQDKELTWDAYTNYGHIVQRAASLALTIDSEQSYLEDSLRIFHYRLGADGSVKRGAELSAIEYNDFGWQEPAPGGGGRLTVDFPDGDGLYCVQYRTILDGHFVDGQCQSTVELDSAGQAPTQLHATVKTYYGGKLALKNGQQRPDGYVAWQTLLNPDQSSLDSLSLTSTPSSEQVVDLSTLVVYGTRVAVDGKLVPDTRRALTPGVDYSASYLPDPADPAGRMQLQLDFLHAIDRAYELSYCASVYVSLPVQELTVHNASILHAQGEGAHSFEVAASVPVLVNKGGGVMQGEPASLEVIKTDQSGKALAAGVFELSDRNGNTVAQAQGGADGRCRFDALVAGRYTLHELQAPSGYMVSATLAKGVVLELGSGASTYTAVDPPLPTSQPMPTPPLATTPVPPIGKAPKPPLVIEDTPPGLDVPLQPDQPQQPDQPGQPDQPQQPDQPGQPDQPQDPDRPQQPGDGAGETDEVTDPGQGGSDQWQVSSPPQTARPGQPGASLVVRPSAEEDVQGLGTPAEPVNPVVLTGLLAGLALIGCALLLWWLFWWWRRRRRRRVPEEEELLDLSFDEKGDYPV